MSEQRAWISLMALGLGLMIMAVSLFSASQVICFGGSEASAKKIYWPAKILPDHLLYPLVTGVDRTILLIAGPEEKLYLKVDYGQLRYQAAMSLIEKQELSLALSTLTKSQKYFNEALIAALTNPNLSVDLRRHILVKADENITLSRQAGQFFADDWRSIVDQLNDQNRVLLNRLAAELS